MCCDTALKGFRHSSLLSSIYSLSPLPLFSWATHLDPNQPFRAVDAVAALDAIVLGEEALPEEVGTPDALPDGSGVPTRPSLVWLLQQSTLEVHVVYATSVLFPRPLLSLIPFLRNSTYFLGSRRSEHPSPSPINHACLVRLGWWWWWWWWWW